MKVRIEILTHKMGLNFLLGHLKLNLNKILSSHILGLGPLELG